MFFHFRENDLQDSFEERIIQPTEVACGSNARGGNKFVEKEDGAHSTMSTTQIEKIFSEEGGAIQFSVA